LFKADDLDEQSRMRIRREAQALGQLGNHPHIVTLHDVGEEDGRPYFVTQYLPGGSVQELLNKADSHRLPLGRALIVADQICQALAYAHARGIIHRDLKPSNVWLSQEGAVKLGDFGLATSLDHSKLSIEGVLMGTAAYLPPEQLQGRKLDARSDLYSLGAMLYEMTTGRPPFIGDSFVSLIAQHLNAQPVAPSCHNPEIPPALDALILRLLAKAPEARYDSAETVRAALQEISTQVIKTDTADHHPESHVLDRLANDVFVGREREMDELREGLEETLAGRGQAVALLGDAGIGKTRTAMEFGTYAQLRGARVLVGRCHEVAGAPPFWPWVQIVRTYMAEQEPEIVRTALGSGAATIARVIPDVREYFPELPVPHSVEPEQERFRAFDSLTTLLKNIAKDKPVVVLIDDLQWADVSSLLFLQFLAREVNSSRLLIMVTCRESDAETHPLLTQTLSAFARGPGGRTLVLKGLTEQDVNRFMEITTGQIPSAEIATAVYQKTEGHPFFMTEVVRLLAIERKPAVNGGAQAFAELPLPQSVQRVISRRVENLSQDCRELLTIAASIGREFTLPVLEAVVNSWQSSLVSAPVLSLLEEAIAARLITIGPNGVGRYSFSHALICEVLGNTLPLSQRTRLQTNIGEALERLFSAAVEKHVAELAYRFYEAARGGGDAKKAIAYAQHAGNRAMSLLAYEEAAEHYGRALQLLELKEENEDLQGELTLALGEAQRRAGDAPKAQETFLAAAAVARRRRTRDEKHAAVLLARAALGYGATLFTPTNADSTLIKLFEEALDVLGEEESVLRARIMAQLAMGLYYSEPERGRTLSEQAVNIAARINDARTLAVVYSARRYAIAFPENLDERLQVSTEMVELGEQHGYREVEILGHQWRTADVLEQGDCGAVDREITNHARLAAELQQPLHRWYNLVFQAMSSLMQGQLAEGERLVYEALNSGKRVQSQTPLIFFSIQLYQLRILQGRSQELEEAVKKLIKQNPRLVVWQCALAYLYCELDRREEAYRIFAPLAANEFASIPHDLNWPIAVALLSETCCFLGDTRAAAILYEQLLPYAERNIVVGPAIASYGSVAYYLGLLATTTRRWQEAEVHFEQARTMNARMAAWPGVAHAATAHAHMLLTRHRLGDLEKAIALLNQALATAQGLGMTGLAAKIQKLVGFANHLQGQEEMAVGAHSQQGDAKEQDSEQASLNSPSLRVPTRDPRRQPSDTTSQSSSSQPQSALFRPEGDYWTLSYEGEVLRLKNSSGLHYLASLLQHPNREFHVLDLVKVGKGTGNAISPSGEEAAAMGLPADGLGDAGEILDAPARTAYKHRIAELREELEEAEEFNDVGRAERLREEMEFLAQELASAVGLGGRNRKAASAVERARVNVTRAIKGAIKKIAEQNVSFELYLSTTIKTGTFCSYTPDPRIPVSWEF
jgi:tetratricopeptide (TPR) repeat protein